MRYRTLFGSVTAIVLGLTVAAGTGEAVNLQAWDQQINGPGRFKVLAAFGKAAVLDTETQLVWEQSPNPFFLLNWFDAQTHCIRRTVGNRRGWRLPTAQELESLVDPSNIEGGVLLLPALPVGHPFSNVQLLYWSASTVAGDTGLAWLVPVDGRGAAPASKSEDLFHVWCVRGGRGVDPQ